MTSPQNKKKGVLIHTPSVLFLNVTLHLNFFSEEHSLPSRATTIIIAIVITINDTYALIQNLQNAVKGFILLGHHNKPEHYLLSLAFYE